MQVTAHDNVLVGDQRAAAALCLRTWMYDAQPDSGRPSGGEQSRRLGNCFDVHAVHNRCGHVGSAFSKRRSWWSRLTQRSAGVVAVDASAALAGTSTWHDMTPIVTKHNVVLHPVAPTEYVSDPAIDGGDEDGGGGGGATESSQQIQVSDDDTFYGVFPWMLRAVGDSQVARWKRKCAVHASAVMAANIR